MAEYINRGAFIQALAEAECDILPADDLDGFTFDRVCEVIEAIPAADVVPVVRCKDCTAQQSCNIAQYLGMDGFCSYGERKEGDNGR